MVDQGAWLHELAKAEVHPDAEKILQIGNPTDPQQKVEESTIRFLNQLRQKFVDFAKILNGYSDGSAKFQEVKIYSVAHTPADFMIYRNQVKLVVSNAAHGVIQLTFQQHYRGTLAVDGASASAEAASASAAGNAAVSADSVFAARPIAEVVARIGALRNVTWTFDGEMVSPDEVARYYFAEFVRATRDSRRSRAGNQLLLEQIKALLQEKGLSL